MRINKKIKKILKKVFIKGYRKAIKIIKVKKNRIIFESFLGRNVSGNPKYIYEYLVQKNWDEKYELIWIVNDINQDIKGIHKKIKRKSIKYYYYMATAKYWIVNCRQPNEIIKNTNTIYVQTWHGTPLKKLGMDMESVNMAGQVNIKDYKEKFRKSSSRWDYLISQNEYSTQIFKRAFAFGKEGLESGYPANEILYEKNNEKDIKCLKEKFEINKDKKVILYAPTWRDDSFYKKGHYKMEIQLNLEQMQKELGDEYVILLKMHYLISDSINIEKFKNFAYNFSEGFDIQELYLVADILITDYSSTMFDFANLKRNMIFYAYDIEKYRDSLRGFYFNFEEEAPGPIVRNTGEVIKTIKNLEKVEKEYREKKTKFYNKFCYIDQKGDATKKIIEKILEPIIDDN